MTLASETLCCCCVLDDVTPHLLYASSLLKNVALGLFIVGNCVCAFVCMCVYVCVCIHVYACVPRSTQLPLWSGCAVGLLQLLPATPVSL